MTDAAPSDLYRDRLLDAMLAVAPETGWTQAGFDRATEAAGLTQGQALLACPRGVFDLLEAFSRRGARAAGERLRAPDIAAMKIREKVKAGVAAWLDAQEKHKAAMKRAAASPGNVLTGPQALWAAADAIWTGLGDKSTDYNWYTKRLILTGVLGSTLLCWIGTDDRAEVDAFLDRRIEDVMKFERFKAQARDAAAKWPNPLDILGARK